MTESTSAPKRTRAAAKKTTQPRTRTPKPKIEVQMTPKAAKLLHLVTDEEREAKLTAYHALKSANVPIPAELAEEVEGWIVELNAARELEDQAARGQAAQIEERIAEANRNGPWYVRNGYPAPFNLRLDRQTEKRRIELKARGTPGDLHPLQDEDLKDPVLRRNVGLGLCEVIPAGEAAMIIEKQTTNMTHRVHTPLSILRNELGQPYAQGAVRVEAEFNSQGVTVARLDPAQMQGHIHDRNIGGRNSWGGLQRVNPGEVAPQPQGPQQATSVVSGFVPTGGNPAIISQGGIFADNARAKAVDDLARRKGLGGIGAGLGDVTVTVDPVVRT